MWRKRIWRMYVSNVFLISLKLNTCKVLYESVNGLQIVSTMYLLKISNFIHEIQMNERIILLDLCENDLMNKCWLFYGYQAERFYTLLRMEALYLKLCIIMKPMKWKFTYSIILVWSLKGNVEDKVDFQILHATKSVVSEKFDRSYTIFFDNCMEIIKQVQWNFNWIGDIWNAV